jgi:energy-converting hydrogenase Eha subunit F
VSSASGPPPATSSAGAVANYAQYTGGSGKATASLSPVTIGFVNMQGGLPSESDPEAAIASQAAVR